jgi:hypothetical protein
MTRRPAPPLKTIFRLEYIAEAGLVSKESSLEEFKAADRKSLARILQLLCLEGFLDRVIEEEKKPKDRVYRISSKGLHLLSKGHKENTFHTIITSTTPIANSAFQWPVQLGIIPPTGPLTPIP